jgi:glutaminyl-peptide cyclotransferase
MNRLQKWSSLAGWLMAPLLLFVGLFFITLGQTPLRPVVGETQGNAELKPAAVDGARAFGYLKAICEIGPRPAGSAANEKQRLMVADHFKKNGLEIKEQTFDATDPSNRQRKRLTNLIGSWQPEKKRRVLLGAHYDTRPYPDQDPDPAKRRGRFIGANDGASGVALLMEIANHLPKMTSEWGVDLVLFDGEELVYQDGDPYFLGSRHFARQYLAQARGRDWKYDAGLVLDMVADKDLLIEQEQYSIEYARNVVGDVWDVAARLGEKRFSRSVGPAVLDDHIPLNQAKIPTADLIDFEYPHWHTIDDTPENCSGESMAAVGRVVTAWIGLGPVSSRKK